MLLSDPIRKKLEKRLKFIYKKNYHPEIAANLGMIMEKYQRAGENKKKWDEKDTVLITYGDSIKNTEEKPLSTLKYFLDNYLKEQFSAIHVLPFFPYSSDDGFSVIDFRKVNPELGNWDDIKELTENFGLMTDLVINHVSSQSQWFQNFLAQKGKGTDYFITEDPQTDLSKVTRPRSSSLLTPYKTANGVKYVWTTFSADQIDLNFSNPEVLLEMADILLDYISKGARIIRLDAIAFLWKEPGTTCLHLPETHEIVKLFRDISEFINPSAIILTETNVPNTENLSYFGDGDEAHMVYQFSLPPLLLHALYAGNSHYLNNWAKTLPQLPNDCTFFNFTASHDGIGVRPLEGLLPDDELVGLIEKMKSFSGKVSYKNNTDGTQSPYELNITYYDALKGTKNGTDNFQVERFLTSQIIMMSFMGIPAFYIHSLTATPNYTEGVTKTGQNRTINRKKWDADELKKLLNSNTNHKKVFESLKYLIKIRSQQKAFHPNAKQEITDAGNKIFSLLRYSTDGEQKVLLAANLTQESRTVQISENLKNLNFDLIQKKKLKHIVLQPYQSVWLTDLSNSSNR